MARLVDFDLGSNVIELEIMRNNIDWKKYQKMFLTASCDLEMNKLIWTNIDKIRTMISHWAFPEKNFYPHPLLGISIFLKLTPWISSQIYRDPLEFFALTPLEIHVSPSNFWCTPWNFPLISSTGGYNFFFWNSLIML